MIGGVPVALLGAIYYLSILVLTVLYLNKKTRSYKNTNKESINDNESILKLIAWMTIVGMLASLWFVFLQIFVIKAICLYCIFSALTSFCFLLLGYMC